MRAAQGNGTFDVTARVTDAAGNAGPNSGAFPVTVDTAAPTAAVAITAIATDSGTSSSDFVTNDTTLTVSGTHGLLGAGETVQVSSDGGASWFDVTTSTASTWSYTDPTPHGTSFTYQVRIVDTVGNVDANTDSQAVTIDTLPPMRRRSPRSRRMAAAASTPPRPRRARRWWWASRAPGRWATR